MGGQVGNKLEDQGWGAPAVGTASGRRTRTWGLGHGTQAGCPGCWWHGDRRERWCPGSGTQWPECSWPHGAGTGRRRPWGSRAGLCGMAARRVEPWVFCTRGQVSKRRKPDLIREGGPDCDSRQAGLPSLPGACPRPPASHTLSQVLLLLCPTQAQGFRPLSPLQDYRGPS